MVVPDETLQSSSTFSTSGAVVEALTNERIVELCKDKHLLINGNPSVRGFVRLSEHILVKCGTSITQSEATNQDFAYELSRNTRLRVPRVHRFFEHDSRGYLLMDFVHGTRLDAIESNRLTALLPRLAKEVHQFLHSKDIDFLGPRNHAFPTGPLFSETGAGVSLKTPMHLNNWLHERAKSETSGITFDYKSEDCVFCHLDIARRNIILSSDDTFWLLDWEHAGFYPKDFQVYSLLFHSWQDAGFSSDLLLELEANHGWTQDTAILKSLDTIYLNNHRYYFKTSETDTLEAWVRMLDQSQDRSKSHQNNLPLRQLTNRIPPPPPPPPPTFGMQVLVVSSDSQESTWLHQIGNFDDFARL